MEIEARNSELLKRAEENEYMETEIHRLKEKEMEGVVCSLIVDKDELSRKASKTLFYFFLCIQADH